MAGFFGFFDYTKPGKGVEKEDYVPNISSYFNVLFGRLSKLITLNLIYALCLIPVVAVFILFMPFGTETDEEVISMYLFLTGAIMYLSVVGFVPFTAGFHYVLRNFARNDHAWVSSDFFAHTKKNLRQTLPLLAIDTAVSLVLPYLFRFYSTIMNTESGALGTVSFLALTLLVIAGAIYYMMHFYIFQMIVTFDLKLKYILKNSFVLTMGHLPRSIGVFALVVLISGLIASTFEIAIIIAAVIGISLIGYTVVFITNPVIQRRMMDRVDEDSAEG